MSLVVESPGNLSAEFWKVVEFARRCCGRIDASCWSWKSSELLAAVACMHGTHTHSRLTRWLGYIRETSCVNNCKDGFFATCDSDEPILQYGCCCLSLYLCIAGWAQGCEMLCVVKRVGTLVVWWLQLHAGVCDGQFPSGRRRCWHTPTGAHVHRSFQHHHRPGNPTHHVCGYNWHSAGSLRWPFPMLECKCIP